LPRTDAGAATPRRDADDTRARDAACRQRWPVRLARLVVAVASLLACPWAIPEADAARGADARGAAVGGQHRRGAAAAAVRPGPARAAPPAVRQRQAGSSRRIVATAARKPAAAARPDPANNAGAPVSPAVSRALDRAARATGADPALLLAMAWKESRFDPAARNPLSSARGLMQFTRATWLEAVRDFGPRHGLAGHAALLSTDPRDGAISARDPRHLARILKLRDDPRLSAVMAAERIAGERGGLERALGRAAAPADLYLVHLLGPAGARRFLAELRRAPSRPALEAVGQDSVGANQGVFVARGDGSGGRALSLAEVYAAVEGSVAEQRTARAGLLSEPAVASAAGATARRDARSGARPMEVAEAR
jgi:Transglycosylase SLT domain